MASCKCFGKTRGVLLLSAVLLVIAACTPVSAATTNTGDVVSANAGTKIPLRITKIYDDITIPTPKKVHEANAINKVDPSLLPLYCTENGKRVTDRRNGNTIECHSEDLLPPKIAALKAGVLAAIALHRDRLSVLKPDKQITFPDDDVLCTHFAVTNYKQKTFTDSDFLLFVAGAPMELVYTQAWGTWCGSQTPTTRPVAGGVNLPPKYITNTEAFTRLVAREILVALGFGYYTLSTYAARVSVRGKEGVPVVKMPSTIEAAKTHFGCNDVKYMELEYTENDKTTLAYWRGRVMKDELMALQQTAGYYSIITLAAMKDLGFYDVDYTKAENMPWGRDWKCDFFNNKCLDRGISVVKDVFCTKKPATPPTLSCTTDRYALGVCDLTLYNHGMPTPFQYFSEPNLAGAQFAMDYCPIIAPKDTATLCSTGPDTPKPNFVFGEQSRCLDISLPIKYDDTVYSVGVCVKVDCDPVNMRYTVTTSDNKVHECVPHTQFPLPYNGDDGKEVGAKSIANCPMYKEVCRTTADYPEPTPHSDSHSVSSSHHHRSSSHHSSHHDSALTVVQSVWGVTLSLAMVLFMTM